jgi:glycerol-3-phosphate acyltransferase PlsX
VGREDAVRGELAKHGPTPGSIEIRHCTEVVEMGESPATAVRRKRDSSINRAIDLVKDGEADAFFSPAARAPRWRPAS